MHILVLPSWYPSKLSPLRGVFIKEQVSVLVNSGVQVGVIYPEFESVRLLSKKAFKWQRFCLSEGEENGANVMRWHGWYFPTLVRCNAWLFSWVIKWLVSRYIKQYGRPDIIHAHCFMWAGIAATKIQKKHGIPVVITEHSSVFPRKLILQWQVKHILRSADICNEVIAVSPALGRAVKQLGYGQNIKVLPNVVDTGFFSLPGKRRECNKFRLLAVAIFSKNKGIDILLQAFAGAFKGKREVILEIGGDGSERASLELLVKKLDIESQVIFLGMLDKKGVRDAMWRANTFVLSSFVETFGVVLIEAMSTGLPVIATRCGGPEGIVPADNFCQLIDVGDPPQMAQALKAQWKVANELLTVQKELNHYVNENYSPKVVAAQLKSLYKRNM